MHPAIVSSPPTDATDGFGSSGAPATLRAPFGPRVLSRADLSLAPISSLRTAPVLAGIRRKLGKNVQRIELDDLSEHQKLDYIQSALTAFVLTHERLGAPELGGNCLLRDATRLPALNE
jgi:hypothetical protein